MSCKNDRVINNTVRGMGVVASKRGPKYLTGSTLRAGESRNMHLLKGLNLRLSRLAPV